MRLDFLKECKLELRIQRNCLAALSCILLLSTLILSMSVYSTRERIILVPPQLTKQMWVMGGKVSQEYLSEMGGYVAKLFLDLSPGSFTYNHELLLSYATPESYGSLKKQFLKEAEEYTKLQLSTHFKPSEIFASPETLNVSVKGTLSRFVAGKPIGDSIETVSIKFTHRDAGLLLEQVTGGLKNDPQ